MFKTIWNKIKADTTAFIAIIVGVVLIVFLVLPTEKSIEREITEKYNELAQNYDMQSDTYRDFGKALQLKQEIAELQTTSKKTKLINTVVTSLILIGLVGLLATLLQFIYTSLPFTVKKFKGSDGYYNEEEKRDAMPVLASALLSSALIVISVYVVTFIN